MKNKIEIIILAALIVANVVMVADSLLDYKMDKFLDVESGAKEKYIFKK